MFQSNTNTRMRFVEVMLMVLPFVGSLRNFLHEITGKWTNKTLFAVVTRGRTGSTALVEDIDFHPNVICHQELLRNGTTESWAERLPTFRAYLEADATRTFDDYLDLLLKTVEPSVQTVGMKILLNQVAETTDLLNQRGANEGPLGIMARRRARFIYLIRDPVAAALSSALAAKRELFSLHPDDPAFDVKSVRRIPVTLDAKRVCDEVLYAQAAREPGELQLKELKRPYLVVHYEHYVGNREETLRSIFKFLGVADYRSSTASFFVKVTSANVWDDIENADEVMSALIDQGLLPSSAQKRIRQ